MWSDSISIFCVDLIAFKTSHSWFIVHFDDAVLSIIKSVDYLVVFLRLVLFFVYWVYYHLPIASYKNFFYTRMDRESRVEKSCQINIHHRVEPDDDPGQAPSMEIYDWVVGRHVNQMSPDLHNYVCDDWLDCGMIGQLVDCWLSMWYSMLVDGVL